MSLKQTGRQGDSRDIHWRRLQWIPRLSIWRLFRFWDDDMKPTLHDTKIAWVHLCHLLFTGAEAALSYWDWDKMAANLQTTLSNVFSWMIEISLRFVPMGPINNIPALVQIMAWRRPGDKPLSEPMMVTLATYLCVTRSKWVILRKSAR